MNKLLSVLIAGVIATASTAGFAQDKKADAPAATTPKAAVPMKKERKHKKAKKPAATEAPAKSK